MSAANLKPTTIALLVALAILAALLFWIVPSPSNPLITLPTLLPLSPQEAATLTVPKLPPLVRGENAVGEYYRGIFDVCLYFGTREHPGQLKAVTRSCREMVRRLWLKRWDKDATQGWEWPLEELEHGG